MPQKWGWQMPGWHIYYHPCSLRNVREPRENQTMLYFTSKIQIFVCYEFSCRVHLLFFLFPIIVRVRFFFKYQKTWLNATFPLWCEIDLLIYANIVAGNAGISKPCLASVILDVNRATKQFVLLLVGFVTVHLVPSRTAKVLNVKTSQEMRMLSRSLPDV